MSAKDTPSKKKKRNSSLSWNCRVSSASPSNTLNTWYLQHNTSGGLDWQVFTPNTATELPTGKFDLATAQRQHVKGKLPLGNLRTQVSEIQMDNPLNSCRTWWKTWPYGNEKKVTVCLGIPAKKSLSISELKKVGIHKENSVSPAWNMSRMRQNSLLTMICLWPVDAPPGCRVPGGWSISGGPSWLLFESDL